MQGPPQLADRSGFIRRPRVGHGTVGVQRDDGVQRAIVALDLFQVRLENLDGGEFARADRLRQLRGR